MGRFGRINSPILDVVDPPWPQCRTRCGRIIAPWSRLPSGGADLAVPGWAPPGLIPSAPRALAAPIRQSFLPSIRLQERFLVGGRVGWLGNVPHWGKMPWPPLSSSSV